MTGNADCFFEQKIFQQNKVPEQNIRRAIEQSDKLTIYEEAQERKESTDPKDTAHGEERTNEPQEKKASVCIK